MAMRLSGLASGMDTEAVVEQLMKAHNLKKTKIQNKITTTEWKQEKWKDLNSKIYSFYTNQLSKIRLQGNWSVKKATTSNTNKVDVIANTSAPEGTHRIEVKQLASAQFVTGSQLGSDVNLKTTLNSLGFDTSPGTVIHINAKKQKTLEVTNSTTLGDFINALKDAGLNANYDTTHRRLFISSKESGIESSFTIETTVSPQVDKKNKIRDFLSYGSLSTTNKNNVDKHLANYLNDILVDDDRAAIRDKLLDIKLKADFEKYKEDTAKVAEAEEYVKNNGIDPDDENFKAEVEKRLEEMAKAEWGSELDTLLSDYLATGYNATPKNGLLANLGLGDFIKNADGTVELNGNPDAKFIGAKDAKIIYNEVELTGSSNSFTVNGLTLDLKEVTSQGEVITLSVTGNTEAVYNMVKDFIKAYNELLTDMNTAYNAASARGFNPLTDEQKETMTEEQIKKWEDKIKDALLRRDNTLGGLINMFRTSMGNAVNVNGKRLSLTSFGITTKDYSEKGILHISGDEDFNSYSSDNKLMEALTKNPEEVMEVLTKLGDDLYTSLMNKMKRTSLSSALTVYNDKEIDRTLKDYKEDLSKLEKKLAIIEEKYYRQFTAMESAMSKMNSQSAYLSSLLGVGGK